MPPANPPRTLRDLHNYAAGMPPAAEEDSAAGAEEDAASGAEEDAADDGNDDAADDGADDGNDVADNDYATDDADAKCNGSRNSSISSEEMTAFST